MTEFRYSRQQIAEQANFTLKDRDQIDQCRRNYNRLGFAYQMAFVRLTGRLPKQKPLERIEDLLSFVAIELKIDREEINRYAQRQVTVSQHQERLINYLNLKHFQEKERKLLSQFLLQESYRLEQTSALQAKAQQFLHEHKILMPARTTLRRLIGEQRDRAQQEIVHRLRKLLTLKIENRIDQLLVVKERQASGFQQLKEPPGFPSPRALLALIDKLNRIETTGVLEIDLSWLNNNFQKIKTRRAQQYTIYRLRELQPDHRYTIMVCFLWQTYRDTIDQLIDMYIKLIANTERRAQRDLDEKIKERRISIRSSLAMFKTLGKVLLDKKIADEQVRQTAFSKLSRKELKEKLEQLDSLLVGKHSDLFPWIMKRFSYLRQFTPHFLEHLSFQTESKEHEPLLKAIALLRKMNAEGRRKIPDSEDVPTEFIPARIRHFVEQEDEINRRGYECAVLIAIRDEIKRGNLWAPYSKRFGRLDDFFMPEEEWTAIRSDFFQKAGLPVLSKNVGPYLTERLNRAFDQFLSALPDNAYVSIEEDGWHLGSDQKEALPPESERQLIDLEKWLAERMKTIKLPDLLINVDNDLHFTRDFIPPSRQRQREVDDICTVLATIMAYGCNIGPYTMAQLAPGISYNRIKNVSDWYLNEETLRRALTKVVNAIKSLDTVKVWGEGKTSSSDGQQFLFPRKVLQRTYSPKFGDFALEFYSFVADNYAPFYSLPIECTDRDAPFVLDGLLYHESDLELEEHYTDTHGYTEINFAAFALLGRQFSPRIRGLQHQWIYRIDKHKDYGALKPLVAPGNRTIHLDWIEDQWDRMGQFYASLEAGHTTASVALKRLNSCSPKNQFYRANRELGRVFKTEFILRYNSDASLRRRIQRGLLKGEQLHELARNVFYGKRGRISARDFQQQMSTASSLTFILACIIYWQAREIGLALNRNNPEKDGVNVSLLSHISPIGWDNVLLYGEYVLNPDMVQ